MVKINNMLWINIIYTAKITIKKQINREKSTYETHIFLSN